MKITRKDGIEYYRKSSKYDAHIHIRYNQENIDKLKKIAEEHDMKYNTLIRYVLDIFIESWENDER